MKKIILVLIAIFFLVLSIFNAYGSTLIINFSTSADRNFFNITSYHGWTGLPQSGSRVIVQSGELVFSTTVTDLFPLASLSLENTNKIQFKLKTLHSGDAKSNWGSNFKIDFDDGTFMAFNVNLGERAAFEFYGVGDGTNWHYSPAKFVVRDIDGNLYDLGDGAGLEYVNYSIEIENGNLIMTDSLGHNFTRGVGSRKMIKITFDPLRQWSNKSAKAYLDDIIITSRVFVQSISIEGQSSTVEKGNTINLIASVLPADAENKNLIWSSSDSSVAAVEWIGTSAIVRGIKKGTATITATAQDGSGIIASKTITVTSDFVQGEAKYILVDDIVEYQTGYSDIENDPEHNNQYKYIQNPYSLNGVTLDNFMGYVDFNDKWLDIAYKQFPKVGTYKVQYRVKDNPPTAANNSNFANYRYYSDVVESTIYVHRKPVAMYTISGSTVIDNSYDLDHSISHLTKGIDLWEWQYVNSNGYTWKGSYGTAPGAWGTKQEGIDTVNYLIWLYSGVQYKIILRVRDIEGTWSEPCIKAAGEISRPVADFVIDKNPMLYKTDTQKITNMSYDTNGLTLSYQWTVLRNGTSIMTSTSNDITSELNAKIASLYPNITGKYDISLKVINSAGLESDVVTKNFEVIVKNDAPTVNFELISNENPAWTFPRILDLYTLPYRPLNTLFHEEYARIDTYAYDPNPDNTGFDYIWKFERFAVKNINEILGTANNIYTSNFVNSFKNQGYGWGAYRITMKVTDKPPMPPYQSTDTKTATVTKCYYIVPELSMTGGFESANTEIMVGDTVNLKAKTNKETENVYCAFAGTNYILSKVSEDSNFAYWEKNIIVPDNITESGTYQLQFVGNTTYGGNGSITREIRDTVPLDIIALKLINFRITNIVNHAHITFPYTKDMLISKLIPYKTGYYVTFRIDSKGKPDSVFGRVDIGNNGSIDQIINLTKVASGDTETWQGRFYAGTRLPAGTVISIKSDCKKGTTVYDYNQKENWDGRSLITNGSALMDGRINLTN